MNVLAKALVLIHTVMSVACMTWAMLIVLQGRDFGWVEPEQDVLSRRPDGSVEKAVRYASEYDKSIAAVSEAARTRDLTMVHVQPAVDSLRAAEPFLPGNRLFFLSEIDRLQNAPGAIVVKRLQDLGLTVDPNTGRLGKPVFEQKEVAVIKQSYKTYTADMAKLLKEIEQVEKEIQKIAIDTRNMTDELTGTVPDAKDPLKNPPIYVHPGLYQLTEVEFEAQRQFKIEISAIKKKWAENIEDARRYQQRRVGLEATLEQLLPPMPKNEPKVEKKKL